MARMLDGFNREDFSNDVTYAVKALVFTCAIAGLYFVLLTYKLEQSPHVDAALVLGAGSMVLTLLAVLSGAASLRALGRELPDKLKGELDEANRWALITILFLLNFSILYAMTPEGPTAPTTIGTGSKVFLLAQAALLALIAIVSIRWDYKLWKISGGHVGETIENYLATDPRVSIKLLCDRVSVFTAAEIYHSAEHQLSRQSRNWMLVDVLGLFLIVVGTIFSLIIVDDPQYNLLILSIFHLGYSVLILKMVILGWLTPVGYLKEC